MEKKFKWISKGVGRQTNKQAKLENKGAARSKKRKANRAVQVLASSIEVLILF